MRFIHAFYALGAFALLASTSVRPVWAGSFDEQGRFTRTAPGTGFEANEYDGLQGSLQSRAIIAAIEPEQFAGQAVTDALEGERALALDRTALFDVQVDLGVATGDTSNRRVQLRLWQKREGGRVRPQIVWQRPDGNGAPFTVGALVLVPSGRVTSDGWEEWTTGAFDFLLGGALPPSLLLEDSGSNGNPFDASLSRRALVDAIEVEELGAPRWDGASCSPGSACRFGRPVDPAIEEGPDFARAEHREQYLARRAFEWATFLGHRRARALEATTARSFEALARLGGGPGFWPTLGRIIDATEDGHAQRPIVTGASNLAPGVCLHLGEADLLEGAPRRPLVFRSAEGHPAAARLRAGDALVAVNGEPVEDWLDRRQDELPFSADPRVRPVAVVPQLLQRAVREGLRLDFVRCDPDCAPVSIDYGQLAEDLWDRGVPAWARRTLACDPRFERSGDVSDVASADHVDVRAEGDATVLRINATTGPGFGNFAAWTSEVDEAFDPAPARLVLDHRRGDGGSFLGLHYLTRPFFGPEDGPISVVFPWLFERPEAPALRAALAACARTSGGFNCGGAQWVTPQGVAPNVPNPGGARTTKLAVLTGLDVSGNDWLTDHLRRRRPNTRVFGPAPTFGAFGEVVGLPAHDIGFVGPRLQWTGGLVAFGDLDPLTDFLDGDGVAPDVVVFQKQSDAVAGIDTQLQEALTWLASE